MSTTLNPASHVSPLDRYATPVPPPLPDHPAVAEVMAGKRYVTYPYVVSVVILSFRRNLGGARLVETGQWPIGPLFAAAVVTLLFGWWGFPWGIIWTPLTLLDLARGGQDHTRKILTAIVGAPEAKRILSIAPKPKPPATIWLVRLLVLLPVLFLGLLFLAAALSSNAR